MHSSHPLSGDTPPVRSGFGGGKQWLQHALGAAALTLLTEPQALEPLLAGKARVSHGKWGGALELQSVAGQEVDTSATSGKQEAFSQG